MLNDKELEFLKLILEDDEVSGRELLKEFITLNEEKESD